LLLSTSCSTLAFGNLFTAFLWPTWLQAATTAHRHANCGQDGGTFGAGQKQKDDKKRCTECSSNTVGKLSVNPFGWQLLFCGLLHILAASVLRCFYGPLTVALDCPQSFYMGLYALLEGCIELKAILYKYFHRNCVYRGPTP